MLSIPNEAVPPDRIQRFPFGKFIIKGTDAADLLQRISTNDLSARSADSVQQTLVITDKGRIVDAIWLVPQSDSFLVLTADNHPGNVMAFLNRYIIMDDVTLEPAVDPLTVDVSFTQTAEGFRGTYFGHPATFTVTYSDVHSTDDNAERFERWRIVNGIPAAGKELIPDYNPLELNLWPLISFTKGCYIGQEVIARLETYRKIQRSLCLWFSEGQIVGQPELVDGYQHVIGRVTSAMKSDGQTIGLCVIGARHAIADSELSVAGGGKIRILTVFQKEGYGRA